MTEMNAIHILNHGQWQQYIHKEDMTMDEWIKFQEALNAAMEALAIQAAIKSLAIQLRND